MRMRQSGKHSPHGAEATRKAEHALASAILEHEATVLSMHKAYARSIADLSDQQSQELNFMLIQDAECCMQRLLEGQAEGRSQQDKLLLTEEMRVHELEAKHAAVLKGVQAEQEKAVAEAVRTERAKCRGMVDLMLKRGPCADYPWSYCLVYGVTLD